MIFVRDADVLIAVRGNSHRDDVRIASVSIALSIYRSWVSGVVLHIWWHIWIVAYTQCMIRLKVCQKMESSGET
jgi:hypothetical protein